MVGFGVCGLVGMIGGIKKMAVLGIVLSEQGLMMMVFGLVGLLISMRCFLAIRSMLNRGGTKNQPPST